MPFNDSPAGIGVSLRTDAQTHTWKDRHSYSDVNKENWLWNKKIPRSNPDIRKLLGFCKNGQNRLFDFRWFFKNFISWITIALRQQAQNIQAHQVHLAGNSSHSLFHASFTLFQYMHDKIHLLMEDTYKSN